MHMTYNAGVDVEGWRCVCECDVEDMVLMNDVCVTSFVTVHVGVSSVYNGLVVNLN